MPRHLITVRFIFYIDTVPIITFCSDCIIRQCRYVPVHLNRDTFLYYGLDRLFVTEFNIGMSLLFRAYKDFNRIYIIPPPFDNTSYVERQPPSLLQVRYCEQRMFPSVRVPSITPTTGLDPRAREAEPPKEKQHWIVLFFKSIAVFCFSSRQWYQKLTYLSLRNLTLYQLSYHSNFNVLLPVIFQKFDVQKWNWFVVDGEKVNA